MCHRAERGSGPACVGPAQSRRGSRLGRRAPLRLRGNGARVRGDAARAGHQRATGRGGQ